MKKYPLNINKPGFMKYIFTIVTLLFFSCLQAQNVNMVWAKSMGGASNDLGRSIAVDALGNVYTTGYFSGTADFDPGPGTYNLTSAGYSDIFISKLDASGNFVWAKDMGGSGAAAYGESIAVDASGNVYTTGYFTGTADFDPGAGTYNLTSAGGRDIFVSKLDSSGNFVWAKRMGGASGDEGYSIAIDASGNVYTTGDFQGTTDFDPGAGTYNLTSAGGRDIFVSKLDASGNFVWAKDMGGTSNDFGNSIAVDALGNVYTTGDFLGTADFDPGPGTYNLTAAYVDIFVSKLNASGNFVWAKDMGGGAATGNSIAVDASFNVCTTGNFNGTVDFDPGAGTYNLTSVTGGFDIFVSKLDSSGKFVWAKKMGGDSTYDNQGNSIAVDASGNVYTTGQFNGTVDFDPGPGTYNLTSAGQGDIFVSKLDASGNFVWAKRMGGTSWDGGSFIAVDASGNVYTTGDFQGTANFDPGTGTFNLTSAGGYDIFVEKLSQTSALPVTWLNFNGVLRNNETYLNWSTANEFNSKGFEVQKSMDGQTFADIGFVEGAGNSSIINNYSYTDAKVQSGTNYYRLKQVDLDGRFSYSSVIQIEYSSFKWAVLGNPVANNSWVQLQLDKKANVSLQIISINGAIIKTINKGNIAAGTYSIQLNLPNTNTNMYIVRLVVNGETFSKKIIK